MNKFTHLKIVLLLFLSMSAMSCESLNSLNNHNSKKQGYYQPQQPIKSYKTNIKISQDEVDLDKRITNLINETMIFFELNHTADLQVYILKAKVLIIGNYTNDFKFKEFIQLVNKYPYINEMNNYAVHSKVRSRSEVFSDNYSQTKLKQALVFSGFARQNEIIKTLIHQSVGYAVGIVDTDNLPNYVNLLQTQGLAKLVILFTGDGELPKTPNTPEADKTLKKIKFTKTKTIELNSQELEVLNPVLKDESVIESEELKIK